MAEPNGHLPVLAGAVLRTLDPRPGETALDCTLGRGGHARQMAERLGHDGLVIAFDLDAGNVTDALREGFPPCRIELRQGSFSEAPAILAAVGRAVDVVLADLGFASTQMDDPERGFSFASDGPLDMRFDRERGRTAADLVAELGERELAETIRMLGEEPLARRIAQLIAVERRRAPLRRTAELAELVRRAYGARARHSRLHPATRTFMALRIAVNDELNALAGLLREVERGAEAVRDGQPSWLRAGARVGIISFHSLEDRLVKQCFARLVGAGVASRLTSRPVVADEVELAENPRARSAKLRAVRIG